MSKSRKEIELHQRRDYVFKAAEKLFAERGFDGVTMADIAAASEFSVGSLYLFFESKEMLIEQLLLLRIGQFAETVAAEADKDLPAKEKLEGMINAILDLFLEHLDSFKLVMKEAKGVDFCITQGSFGEGFQSAMRKILDDTAEIFKQGILEGTFRSDEDPMFLSHFLHASIHTLVNYVLSTGDKARVEDIRAGMFDLLYHGIIAKPGGRKK